MCIDISQEFGDLRERVSEDIEKLGRYFPNSPDALARIADLQKILPDLERFHNGYNQQKQVIEDGVAKADSDMLRASWHQRLEAHERQEADRLRDYQTRVNEILPEDGG